MKKILYGFVSIFMCLGLTCFGQENLLDNGDFTKGKSEWKGDYDVVSEGVNKVAVMELDDRKIQSIEQKIRTKGLKDLVLTFRYKTSPDLECRGAKVGFYREDSSSTFRDSELVATEEWKEYKWDFGDVRDAKKMMLRIEVKEGKGQVLLDDFVLVPK